jgi:hypothetical protein
MSASLVLTTLPAAAATTAAAAAEASISTHLVLLGHGVIVSNLSLADLDVGGAATPTSSTATAPAPANTAANTADLHAQTSMQTLAQHSAKIVGSSRCFPVMLPVLVRTRTDHCYQKLQLHIGTSSPCL